MKNILLLFTIAFLAIACNETRYKSEINDVDGLLVKIDSSETKLAALDTNGLDQAGRTFKQKYGYIQQMQAESKDTIGRKLAFLMTEFRSMRKPYAHLKSEYADAKKELDFSKKQLVDLRHDLKHNLLDTNIVHRVVKTEKEASEQALVQSEKVLIKKTSLDQQSEILLPKMDSVITVIKTQNK